MAEPYVSDSKSTEELLILLSKLWELNYPGQSDS